MKKTKNGFTLIELLAVIVILSLLILIAVPAIAKLVEQSKKNAFLAEFNSMFDIAETYYTDNYQSLKTCPQIIINLKALKSLGYTDKNNSSFAGGYVRYGSEEMLVYTDGKYILDSDSKLNEITVSDEELLLKNSELVSLEEVNDAVNSSLTELTESGFINCAIGE